MQMNLTMSDLIETAECLKDGEAIDLGCPYTWLTSRAATAKFGFMNPESSTDIVVNNGKDGDLSAKTPKPYEKWQEKNPLGFVKKEALLKLLKELQIGK